MPHIIRMASRSAVCGCQPKRLEKDFAVIEKQTPNNAWQKYRGYEDWELSFEWERKNVLLGMSEVTVKWAISGQEDRGGVGSGLYRGGVGSGLYRVVYYGDAKTVWLWSLRVLVIYSRLSEWGFCRRVMLGSWGEYECRVLWERLCEMMENLIPMFYPIIKVEWAIINNYV